MPNKPISFIGKSGRFYIQNTLNSQRFAMYDSPTSYSEGLQIPSYISIEFAREDFLKLLTITRKVINTQQVQSIPPASPKKEVIMIAQRKHHKPRHCPTTDNLVTARPTMVNSFDASSPLERGECLDDRSFD